MDDSRNNDTPDERERDARTAERRRDFTRRARVRAGSLHAVWRVAEVVPAYRLRYERASLAARELNRRWSKGLSASRVERSAQTC